MKINRYLPRQRYEHPSEKNVVLWKDALLGEVRKSPDLFISLDDCIQEMERSISSQHSQRDLELLVSCLPSYDLLFRFQDSLSSNNVQESARVIEISFAVKNIINQLIKNGASLFNNLTNSTLRKTWGDETPLFLIGAMMGMSDQIPSVSSMTTAQVREIIVCLCEYEDIDVLTRIWPDLDQGGKDFLADFAWKHIPTALLNQCKFIADPLDGWWKWAIDRNPPGSPGRAEIEITSSHRSHLSSHLLLAQISSQPSEIKIAIQKKTEDETQFLATAMLGWARTLDGKQPNDRQIKSFSKRIEGLEGAWLFSKEREILNSALSSLAFGILMVEDSLSHYAYKYSPPGFNGHQNAFENILRSTETQSISCWSDLLFIDIARISAKGYAICFKEQHGNSSYIANSILTNHMLNCISQKFHRAEEKDPDLASMFWVHAARACKPNSGEFPPGQNSMTPEISCVVMEANIWNLALLRVQRRKNSTGILSPPLNSRERALIKSTKRLNDIGATLNVNFQSSLFLHKALFNDPYAPGWLISILEKIVLSKNSDTPTGSDKQKRRL